MSHQSGSSRLRAGAGDRTSDRFLAPPTLPITGESEEGTMRKRTPISKTVRFEVFKRDGFACQYCGATPPAVILEADHIIPRSGGGSDQIDNLLTACFSCNRGKGARSLKKIPKSINDRFNEISEGEEQLRAYEKLLSTRKRKEKNDTNTLEKIFQRYFKDVVFSDKFRSQIQNTFLRLLPFSEIKEAMEIACGRGFSDGERTTKYFCGICWTKIKGNPRG